MDQKTKDFINEYHHKGFNIFPIKEMNKTISYKWGEWMHKKQTKEDLINIFTLFKDQKHQLNIGIITGEVSNLIVIDVDKRNGGIASHFFKYNTMCIRTWSGGHHFYFKYNKEVTSRKNLKGIFQGVDIQSDGKCVFAPPTKFIFDGKSGQYNISNPDIPIKEFPQELINEIQKELDKRQGEDTYMRNMHKELPSKDGYITVGDYFNKVAIWEDILIPHGWVKLFNRNNVTFWKRPNKKKGISATTNWNDSDILYLFTSSDAHLDQKGYQKFTVFVKLYHDGNYKNAIEDIIIKYNLQDLYGRKQK